MTIHRPRVATTLMAVMLAACGSSTAPAPSAEADKTAGQVFADALDNLSRSSSVHMTLTSAADGTGTIDLGRDSGRLSLDLPGTGLVTMDIVGGTVYVESGGQAMQLANADAKGILMFLPSTMAQCAAKQHGSLTKGATSTINGVSVIEIKDDGHAPGGQPSSYFISLGPTTKLVRVTSSGSPAPGGSAQCGASPSPSPTSSSSTPGTSSSQQLDFDYTHPAPVVTAPPVTAG